MKHKLYLTLGAKGGTGKTLAITALADFLTQNGVSFSAYDCDLENVGKASAFSTAYKSAKRINLRSVRDCDRLLTEAAENEISLADLPANAGGDFLQWWAELANSGTIEELELEVFGIGAITPEVGSFAAVAQWAEVLGERIQYIIALNHRIQQRVSVPKEELFDEYFNSKTGKLFRSTFRPREMELSGLYEGSMIALAKSGLMPSEALSDQQINILDRSRIRSWTVKVHDEIRSHII